MLKIILLISIGIVVAEAAECTTDCSKVCCKSVRCTEDQILVRNVLNCGCCNQCRTIIREGEHCNPVIFGGPPPTTQCEEGTHCTYDEYYGTTICVGYD
ncbi:uncharacterized protein TNCT_444871 [Trichonephila clavata]|uniref:Uncharacterized protein n=1 Tax=Trichonephila clavata TaxID=2740835 RepID=A0A8X6HN47_TRICU|nr:uncharacterized protein TNCT_444871 [Trichonephila clavata]